MRSLFLTEVPPYFCTTTSILIYYQIEDNVGLFLSLPLLFLGFFDADAHRLVLHRRQNRSRLQGLPDTKLARLVRHHLPRYRGALGMPTAFLEHRFDTDCMLAEYPCNSRQDSLLIHD